MSAGNFFRYKADYIYVPKAFRYKPKRDYEIDFIYDDAEQELADFLVDLKKSLDEKRIYGYKIKVNIDDDETYFDRYSRKVATITIYGFFDDFDIDIEFPIYILKAYGYYWAFSVDYYYDEDKREEYGDYRKFEDVFLKVIDILEKKLSKHFDKYVVEYRASSGETWYKKVD
jgi:hypothetical protein